MKFLNKDFRFPQRNSLLKQEKAASALEKFNAGFTLVEILVYVVVLSLVSGVVIMFVFQTLGVNESSRRTRENLDNARRVLDTIAQEIRHAESVYTPTTSFGTSLGQLSLETLRDLPADENSTYVDFYVDNEGVFLKRESESAQLLTSEKVRATKLTFTNLDGGSGKVAVRIELTVEPDIQSALGSNDSVSLSTTAVLRSY